MADAPKLAPKTRAPRHREPGCCSQRKISSGVCAPLLALAGCRGRLRRRDGDSGRRGSRRHAGGGRRVCIFARGPRALAAREHECQNDDDEDGACDPCPYGGSAHPALHLHLTLHLHSPIEVSGVRHGDLPSLMSVDRQPRGVAPGSAPWNPSSDGLQADHERPPSLVGIVCVEDQLGLGDDGGELAIAAGDARLQHYGGASAMQRHADGVRCVAFGTAAKKFVLLSMVAVRPPSGRLMLAVIPPSVSPNAMTAPPWSTPRRLHNSARTGSSASVRSGERWMIFTPRSLVNAAISGSAIAVPLLRSMCS